MYQSPRGEGICQPCGADVSLNLGSCFSLQKEMYASQLWFASGNFRHHPASRLLERALCALAHAVPRLSVGKHPVWPVLFDEFRASIATCFSRSSQCLCVTNRTPRVFHKPLCACGGFFGLGQSLRPCDVDTLTLRVKEVHEASRSAEYFFAAPVQAGVQLAE